MILVGMTGPIGHGKSTFASALKQLEPASEHLESSLIIAEVANDLHAALTDIPDPYDIDSLNNWLKTLPAILLQRVNTRTTFEQIKLNTSEIDQHPIEYQKLILHVEDLQRQPDLAKHAITRENKESYRPLLQWLGGYLVQKVDKGLWYNEIVRRVYKAESRGCKLCIVGGLRYPSDAAILRQAGAIIFKVYRPAHLQNDMLDPTERERENIRPDCTIASNGSVDDLSRCAAQIIEDIKSGQLQSTYQSSRFAA
jgi:energy-coupling factor transporter ATP-binding protein EcfA2